MNSVNLIGNLTKDPELRYTPNGVSVTTFTLAINRQFSGQGGEKEVDYINIVVWRQLADLCANYLKKGRKAAVTGRLQARSYDDKEGRKVYITEVVADNVQFLSPKDGQSFDPIRDLGGVVMDDSNDPFATPTKPLDPSQKMPWE